MKKILLLSPFILIAIFAVSCLIVTDSKNNYIALPAEGKTFDVKSFKAIQADGVFNIILSQGSKESVVVKGDLPKDLKVSVEEGTLIIRDTAEGIHTGHRTIKTIIYITLVDINSIEISSVGETTCSDTLKLKNINIHVEGVGSTELWINADTIKVSEEGVGKLTMAGKAIYSELNDDGVGALDAQLFKAEVLHVNVSGVGAAKVYASREIYLQVSGVGGVQYCGPAKVVQSETSGVGKVEHGD